MEFLDTLTIHRAGNEYFFRWESPAASPIQNARLVNAPSSLTGSKVVDADLRTELAQRIEATVRSLSAFHDHRDSVISGNRSDVAVRIEGLGRLLFSQFLPPLFQELIRDLPAGKPLVLATNDLNIPWELLHDGQTILALKCAVGWRLPTEGKIEWRPAPTSSVRRFLFIADPTGDLPEAAQEAEELIDLFDASGEGIEAIFLGSSSGSRATILEALASGVYDLIHYSGHAEPGALILNDGPLTAEEIRANLSGRPLIFLNACRSGRSDNQAPDDDSLPFTGLSAQDLISAFIMAGSIAFIGSRWKVFDASSRDFARRFYNLILDGKPIGEALRQSRRHLAQSRSADPIWASFVLYGDPTLKIAGFERRTTRRATILLARIAGLGRLFHDLDLETAATIHGQLVRQISRDGQRYGGQVHGPLANMLEVRFGVHAGGEDGARQALQAAMAMQATVEEMNQAFDEITAPLGLRLGVSSGPVVDRRIEDVSGTAHHISGDVAAMASKLADAADDGQILVDEPTQRLARSAFAFELASELAGRDGGRPAPVHEVIGVVEDELSTTQFVGRERYLAQLEEQWQLTTTGSGRLVNITGQAGVGKTRLIQAFQERLAGRELRWILAECQEYDRQTPNALLAQVIRGLADINPVDNQTTARSKIESIIQPLVGGNRRRSAELLREGVGLLGQVIGLPVDAPAIESLAPELRQSKVAAIMQEALNHRSALSPIVLFIDDLQWADEASHKALIEIAPFLGRSRVLLLAAYRSSWLPLWPHSTGQKTIVLEDLDTVEQSQLLSALLETEAPPQALVEAITRRTGGNPLFIEEIVGRLRETGALIRVGERWEMADDLESLELPDTVETTIQVRLEELGSHRNVLEIASVIGYEFELPVLETAESVEGEDDRRRLDDTLGLLVKRNLISVSRQWPETLYAFRHRLIHQIVYESLDGKRKAGAHRIVARALVQLYGAAEAPVERLARHYIEGNVRVAAVRNCLASAEHNAANSSNDTALMWYGRTRKIIGAFEVDPPTSQEIRDGATDSAVRDWSVQALRGAATIQWKIGQHEEAQKNYLAALALVKAHQQFTRSERADLCYQLCHVYEAQGEFDEAWRWLQQGLEELGGEEPAEAARIYIWGGLIYLRKGNHKMAEAWSQRGITIAEKWGSIHDQAMGHNLLGIIYRHQGKSEPALEEHELSLSLYRQESDRPGQERAVSNLACVYQDLENWQKAETYFEESRQLSEQTGEVFRLAGAYTNLGELQRLQGAYSRAIYWYQLGQELADEHGLTAIRGITRMNLGASLWAMGELDAAEAKLEESLDILTNVESKQFYAEVRRYLAEVKLAKDQSAEALRLAEEACRWANEVGPEPEKEASQQLIERISRVL